MTVRLYVDAPLARDAQLELPASAARHVQVRRLQPADRLVLFDGRGGEWAATVLHMGRSEVTVRVGDVDPVERELGVRVTLALGVPANERMDFLVEKATELGVAAIQPLLCERSVLRLAGERASRKRDHWQSVAAAAAEQCGRTRVPEVAPVQSLQRWLAALDTDAQRLLLSPRAGAEPLPSVADRTRALLTLSGPEGGLSAQEEAAAAARGFVAARLGDRVLRAETAPLVALAWLGLSLP
jgi:16S rRNA (uracil1498-N3)-methyltransferase